MARSLLEQFYSNDKMNINPLKEGMYDGGTCPDCGAPMDDEGYHAQECPASKASKFAKGNSTFTNSGSEYKSRKPSFSKRQAILKSLLAKGMDIERASAWLDSKGIYENADDDMDSMDDIEDTPESIEKAKIKDFNEELDDVAYFLKNMAYEAEDRKNETRSQEAAYLWNDVRVKLENLMKSYEGMKKTEEAEEAFASPATDLNTPTTF